MLGPKKLASPFHPFHPFHPMDSHHFALFQQPGGAIHASWQRCSTRRLKRCTQAAVVAPWGVTLLGNGNIMGNFMAYTQ